MINVSALQPSGSDSLASRYLVVLVTVLFAVFVVMFPRYTDASKTPFALLCLFALIYLLLNPRQLLSTANLVRAWFAVIILEFTWIAISYYANGAPERGHGFVWDRHFYMLFLIPMFLLFRRVQISDRVLIILLTVSSALALGDIAVDLVRGLDHRAQGMNPNKLGPIQLCISGILLFYALKMPASTLRKLAFTGFLIAFATVVLSQSKTTLVVMAMISLPILAYFTRHLSLPKKLLSLLALVVGLISIYNLPLIQGRFDKAATNVSNYFGCDDQDDCERLGTFGTRAELWKGAWQIFLDSPVIGAGVGSFPAQLEQNWQRYEIPEIVAAHGFKYAHNQYLAALATRGFPGLLLFLLLLAFPVYIAMSCKSDDVSTNVARFSVYLISAVLAIGSLGEDYFEGKPVNVVN